MLILSNNSPADISESIFFDLLVILYDKIDLLNLNKQMSNILIIKHGSLGDIAQISGVLKRY